MQAALLFWLATTANCCGIMICGPRLKRLFDGWLGNAIGLAIWSPDLPSWGGCARDW